jgi:hypothetical protein
LTSGNDRLMATTTSRMSIIALKDRVTVLTSCQQCNTVFPNAGARWSSNFQRRLLCLRWTSRFELATNSRRITDVALPHPLPWQISTHHWCQHRHQRNQHLWLFSVLIRTNLLVRAAPHSAEAHFPKRRGELQIYVNSSSV